MTIPHVPSNPQRIARAVEQNALIDQCNTTTEATDTNSTTLTGHDQRLATLENAGGFCRYENHTGASIPEQLSYLPFDTVVETTPHVSADAGMAAFTINTTGAYVINAGLRWTGSAGAGARAAFLSLNGNQVMGDALSGADTNPGTAMSDNSVATLASLLAGDVIRFMIFQNSGEVLGCAGTRINNIAFNRVSI